MDEPPNVPEQHDPNSENIPSDVDMADDAPPENTNPENDQNIQEDPDYMEYLQTLTQEDLSHTQNNGNHDIFPFFAEPQATEPHAPLEEDPLSLPLIGLPIMQEPDQMNSCLDIGLTLAPISLSQSLLFLPPPSCQWVFL